MGFEFLGKNKRPPQVEKAVKTGDKEAQSAMGKKGAQVGAENRAKRKDEFEAIDELLHVKANAEEEARKESANEHIITPDGEDLTDN